MPDFVLIRGGGDLATGVALRLTRVGIRVVIAELKKPLAVRRTVSFAQAAFSRKCKVEEVTAIRVTKKDVYFGRNEIPLIIDPNLNSVKSLKPIAVIDARMTKHPSELGKEIVPFFVGLGPGFTAGKNCHAVVETLRGHNLGRVFWDGSAATDTGQPGSIVSYNVDRVLRSPGAGFLEPRAEIAQRLHEGDLIAIVNGQEIRAGFDGVLRGLIHPSVELSAGMKIGDLDPRNDPSFCYRVSDKALAIGGGVLEALLTKPEIRQQLWA
jgi:xanthine dehydrogenase accessory factor